ncbi:hypothetical protein DLREEDagr8_32870 [Dongia sp. agr-C8]
MGRVSTPAAAEKQSTMRYAAQHGPQQNLAPVSRHRPGHRAKADCRWRRRPRRLAQAGAAKAYQRLKFRFGKDVTLNALYGLEAVLTGQHWRAITPARKAELQREAQK